MRSALAAEPEALPLTLLDEALLHVQNVRAQWNVQFELGTDHHVDEAKLRRAALSCCRRHALVRARLAPWKWWDNSYQWNLADELDLDLVRVTDCPDDAALERPSCTPRRFPWIPPPRCASSWPGGPVGISS
jgi:hypothetical protein